MRRFTKIFSVGGFKKHKHQLSKLTEKNLENQPEELGNDKEQTQNN